MLAPFNLQGRYNRYCGDSETWSEVIAEFKAKEHRFFYTPDFEFTNPQPPQAENQKRLVTKTRKSEST